MVNSIALVSVAAVLAATSALANPLDSFDLEARRPPRRFGFGPLKSHHRHPTKGGAIAPPPAAPAGDVAAPAPAPAPDAAAPQAPAAPAGRRAFYFEEFEAREPRKHRHRKHRQKGFGGAMGQAAAQPPAAQPSADAAAAPPAPDAAAQAPAAPASRREFDFEELEVRGPLKHKKHPKAGHRLGLPVLKGLGGAIPPPAGDAPPAPPAPDAAAQPPAAPPSRREFDFEELEAREPRRHPHRKHRHGGAKGQPAAAPAPAPDANASAAPAASAAPEPAAPPSRRFYEELDERDFDFDLEERDFDDDELFARDFEIDELD